MLKGAVVGAGNMGRNHIRIHAQMDSVDLVAVADLNKDAIRRAANTYRLTPYTDYRQMMDIEKPDFVSIALPTTQHAKAVCEAVERGVHVLVEKPLAVDRVEGRQMIDRAKEHGVKLMVGHIERFNPAILEIKKELGNQRLGRVFQVHSRRLSAFPARIQDVGVVLDLATHEIDAMRCLLGQEVERVYAEIERKAHRRCEDMLSGLLRFRNGVVGVLDVNWLTPTKVRQLTILGEQGMYLADYLTQDVYWYKNGFDPNGAADQWNTLPVYRGVNEGEMVKLRFRKKEPLGAEIESFVAAIIEDREPEVTGEDGLAALELAQALIESGHTHAPIYMNSTDEASCRS